MRILDQYIILLLLLLAVNNGTQPESALSLANRRSEHTCRTIRAVNPRGEEFHTTNGFVHKSTKFSESHRKRITGHSYISQGNKFRLHVRQAKREDWRKIKSDHCILLAITFAMRKGNLSTSACEERDRGSLFRRLVVSTRMGIGCHTKKKKKKSIPPKLPALSYV
ncbi:uncharacterized protein LOC105285334 isoform X1 [Ooceraea biroi]|uniref:uncharacterized protein LOC105285334 isoform X1 n=1 Tax=Ooceraea biroi TaxID=2015173 RepID=UPI000F08D109|nr:uncharacterized protein LOC105285334 isoform X1 [Ooceraea biroi]